MINFREDLDKAAQDMIEALKQNKTDYSVDEITTILTDVIGNVALDVATKSGKDGLREYTNQLATKIIKISFRISINKEIKK